ncbi:pyridoxamine 5'-phosphate oxidase family protein [Roseomonas elaeocarpi]|uniref:Pyridoxamine 5'-phosphate oxidase family protein n=1 Tax=Roseomonas elaeocarpi TaxID=907779 RepID=A0ABV6JYR7_9PROT
MSDASAPDALRLFLDAGLAALSAALHEHDAPLRTLDVATTGPDGAARQRNVVLRGFDRTTLRLRFHSDRRAAKIVEMRRDPRASLLGWDAGRRLQLRLSGDASLHLDDELADAAWNETKEAERRTYGWSEVPGHVLAAPTPFPAAIDAARHNFCAVVVQLRELELLELGRDTHRRARFRFKDEDPARPVEARWLIP